MCSVPIYIKIISMVNILNLHFPCLVSSSAQSSSNCHHSGLSSNITLKNDLMYSGPILRAHITLFIALITISNYEFVWLHVYCVVYPHLSIIFKEISFCIAGTLSILFQILRIQNTFCNQQVLRKYLSNESIYECLLLSCISKVFQGLEAVFTVSSHSKQIPTYLPTSSSKMKWDYLMGSTYPTGFSQLNQGARYKTQEFNLE